MLKDKLISVLDQSIHIFDLLNMFSIVFTEATDINPYGVCVSNYSVEHPVIATLGKGRGFIFVYVASVAFKTEILAFPNLIVCVSVNKEGTKVAATDEMGITIKIFSIYSSQCLFQFRRGLKNAFISSLSFDSNSENLAVANANYTIHIFNLQNQLEKIPENDLKGIMGKGFNLLTGFFSPDLQLKSSTWKMHLNKMMDCSWRTLNCILKGPTIKFSNEGKKILILTENGRFLKANLTNQNTSGELFVDINKNWLENGKNDNNFLLKQQNFENINSNYNEPSTFSVIDEYFDNKIKETANKIVKENEILNSNKNELDWHMIKN